MMLDWAYPVRLFWLHVTFLEWDQQLTAEEHYIQVDGI